MFDLAKSLKTKEPFQSNSRPALEQSVTAWRANNFRQPLQDLADIGQTYAGLNLKV